MKREPALAELGPSARRPALVTALAVWGPGLLVMLADTDAGNIVIAAQGGLRFGYRLLPLILLLIPLLYMMQELTVRLGLFTGRGFAELVADYFGRRWAWIALAALALATLGSLVTEFTGIAGVGEMVGAPRLATVPLAALCLLGIMLTGQYRRVERIAIAIGLFELSFFFVAWSARPHVATMWRDALGPNLADPDFRYLAAAVIGATFNPWMVFYQASALAEKRLGPAHYAAARTDTAVGAVLTQLVTGAVLIAVAAAIGGDRAGISLDSVGQISEALTPLLGRAVGRLVFGLGVVGAAMVAAIVCSLAFTWGVGEVTGGSRGQPARQGHGFRLVYAAGILGAMAIVFAQGDLVWLSIASQVVNALLLPLVATLLVVLAATALPPPVRLRGAYLWVVTATALLVSVLGVVGALAGLA